jgi:lipoate-protein ligase A
MELSFLRQEQLPEGFDPMGELVRYQPQKPYTAWIPKETAAVLGNSQKIEIELKPENILKEPIPIYKRHGGGGTVLLSPKGFCFGIRFPKIPQNHISDYFDTGTGFLKNFLKEKYDIDSQSRGISDLCIGPKKILGCSLYMPRECVVYLASVLFEPDIENIEKYLAHPSKEPDYREGRTHTDFLTFLKDHLPNEVSLEQFVSEFQDYLTKHAAQFADSI